MNQSPRGSATMTDRRVTLPGSDSADGDTEITGEEAARSARNSMSKTVCDVCGTGFSKARDLVYFPTHWFSFLPVVGFFFFFSWQFL